MLLSVPDKVRQLWDRWNLRGLIIVSLSLQAFLIMFASSRKRRGGWKIIMLIWSAYLLADWVATIAIGLISSGLGLNPSGQANTSIRRENDDILAFWAPFLLLHLGGPDTITSFALEDNELWVRHMLGLALQVLSTVYVFLQSLPKNILWLPSGFMFIAGIIKYAERTRALYLASLHHFGESACRKPNPGPEYQRIQKMYSSIRRAHLPAQTRMIPVQPLMIRTENFENREDREGQTPKDSDPRSILRFAFEFFDTFRGLVAGLLLSPQERHVSREFFRNRSPKDVIRIIEIELSILYEVLHTKVQVVRCKTGYIFRCVSFGCILGAFFSFYFVKKHSFRMFDIRLTYGLLIGAMVLDFISLIFVILSDWTVRGQYWGKWAEYIASTVINRRRWSKSVSQYNFLTYCLNDYPEWINKLAEALHLRSILDAINGTRHRSSKNFNKEQEWRFIFNELKEKSGTAKTVAEGKRICLQRGDGILSKCENENLRQSIQHFEYTESLLMWHIATELCYQDNEDEAKVEVCDENKAGDGPSSENIDYKAICKLLSDYMFYLLMMQPTMMAPVSGNWKLVFQDTCAETNRFLSEHSVSTTKEACKKIRHAAAEIKPRALKGGESKSVLFDARILTGELKKLNGERWKLMSQVWVEFMSYAAINCRAYVHAQQPSNGGELLTFVWLLMNHLGLGTQVSEDEAVRLKFVVGK